MKCIKEKVVAVVIYEPTFKEETFYNSKVIADLDTFKSTCNVIIANRYSENLADVMDKIYIRDLYFRDYKSNSFELIG